MTAPRMTPAEYAAQLAAQAPPLADWQVEAAARILASVEPADSQDGGGRGEVRHGDGN